MKMIERNPFWHDGSRRRNGRKPKDEPYRKTDCKKSGEPNLTVNKTISFIEKLKKDSRILKNRIDETISIVKTNNYIPLSQLFHQLKFIGSDQCSIFALLFTCLWKTSRRQYE
jgi:hypothetical protein